MQMKTKLILVVFISIFVLSACVVQPAHHGKRGKLFTPVRTVLVLEKEHKRRNIVVVNVKPSIKRNCWTHLKHWHCHQ
jgi:hypothetical protein